MVRTRFAAAGCVVLLLSTLLAGSGTVQAASAPAASGTWCTGNHWGAPRPIPHDERQERVARRALAAQDRDYVVKRAAPSQLGVIALVDGDLRKARRELHGVTHVISWTRQSLSDFPPRMRMAVVINGLLDPVMRDVQRGLRATRPLPGRVEEAYWPHAGAIIVEWKAPVPAEVAALDGIRPGGVEVRVVARPYSRRDVDRATDRLIAFLDGHGIDWSSIGGCGSDRGLELSVRAKPQDLPVTQAELDEAAGMRVLVLEGYAIAT